MIRLAIYDYVGVLIKPRDEIYAKIHQEILEKFGKREALFDEKYRKPMNDWKTQYRALGFNDSQLQEARSLARERLIASRDEVEFYEGMDDVIISSFGRRYQAIVSNNDANEIKYQLIKRNLLKYFQYISGHEQDKLKPDPASLNKCMAENSAMPNNTALITDSGNDVEAGISAGIDKILLVDFECKNLRSDIYRKDIWRIQEPFMIKSVLEAL
jgi:HAD superfamily hydrolase (TIGR01549 family)